MKVGFFDSGLGGLTIFKEAIKIVNAEYIYLGDNKNAPYGIKEKDEVKKYIFDNVDFLVKNGCEIIVVACNTATSVAIDELREKYFDVCIIGTEPAVKKAVDSDSVKKVLVCATSITIKEGKLKELIKKIEAEEIVDVVALDKLVGFIENENLEYINKINKKVVENYIKESLSKFDFSKYSHVVLGCTHFPLFKEEFENIFGKNISIIDGSMGVVNNLENKVKLMKKNEIENELNVQLVMTKKSNNFINKFKEITDLEKFETIIK